MIEDASMKRYADEHDMEIKTEVRITRDLRCDGVAEKGGKVFVFEVKPYYNPSNSSAIIKYFSRINDAMKKMGYEYFCFILIIVTEKKLEKEHLEYMKTQMGTIMPHVEVVNYLKHEILDTIDNVTRK